MILGKLMIWDDHYERGLGPREVQFTRHASFGAQDPRRTEY